MASTRPPENSAEPLTPVSEAELLTKALALWLEWRELSLAHLRLAALETQRAARSLTTMLAAGMMLAVLLNGLWFGLMAALVIYLINIGLALNSAILLAGGCSLLPALFLIGIIRRMSHYMGYPALRRSLRPKPAPHHS